MMVEDINKIQSVRELVLVTSNYIDSLLDLMISHYFVRPSEEIRTEFRDYFLRKKLRPDFKQKLDILRHYWIVPKTLYSLIEDIMHKRNIIAHNVKGMELIQDAKSDLFPGHKNLLNVSSPKFRATIGVVFVQLLNCRSLMSLSLEKRKSRCRELDEKLRKDEVLSQFLE